ncbi:MAG: deoxyribodipyrimidine photo-lyase, partial [Gammaproteobacteria bacterium]
MTTRSDSHSAPGDTRPWIVWLRDDLRLRRHAALDAAAARGPVIPVFIVDADSSRRAPGAAACWWQRASVAALEADVAARGGQLIVRRGAADAVLAGLVKESAAAGVCTLRVYDAPGI